MLGGIGFYVIAVVISPYVWPAFWQMIAFFLVLFTYPYWVVVLFPKYVVLLVLYYMIAFGMLHYFRLRKRSA